MRIYLWPSTAGRGGGGLQGNLQYFDRLIQTELDKANFRSSFEELWLTLSYPPLYILPGVVGIEVDFRKYYDKFPYSRFNRRYKKIDVVLKAPEFSEHFDKATQSNYKHKFDIEDKYKSISETELAKILIDKYFEATILIKSKIKKEDTFDFTIFEKVLNSLKNKITPEFLNETAKEQNAKLHALQIENAELKRMERQGRNLPKDKLIRDIRLFYSYKLPENLFYLNRFADFILRRLIAKILDALIIIIYTFQ